MVYAMFGCCVIFHLKHRDEVFLVVLSAWILIFNPTTQLILSEIVINPTLVKF